MQLLANTLLAEVHHDGHSSVERSDVSALMQLASKTGGGLTSLPANEATLSVRIERAIKTWQGELPKSEQGYVFVLEDSETGTVAGICAIEVAVGLNDPCVQLSCRHAGSRFERAECL